MKPVRVVPYDPRWPTFFEVERARVETALGGFVEAIEHIGSTAVPGLDAKPIVDLMAGVRSLQDAGCCSGPLEGIGYEHRGGAGVPGRLFFRTSYPCGVYHLNLATAGGEFWERHLLFRDYLKAHPETAREYAKLKHELALRFRHDREAYTAAKTSFIEAVLESARTNP